MMVSWVCLYYIDLKTHMEITKFTKQIASICTEKPLLEMIAEK